MIELANSASLTSVDPQIATLEVGLEVLEEASADGTLCAEDDLSLEQSGVAEGYLSSIDISVIGPLSSHPGGVLTLRSNEVPSAPVADPLIGMIVADRYRIVAPLGRGGMGIVYKVEHTRIGKLLAMKILTGELSHNPEVVRRFKREALTVSRLESPNTVQVFDFGVSEGLTYLVMELINGASLGSILRAEGPMHFSRLGKIIIQVASSLAEAHKKGIVHRDIKPENIMLLSGEGGAEVAKVLDFGLAKLRETEGQNDVTGKGAIMGTPHYMSPEQVRGEQIDARTDVYGVGALMYRLLTGYHPFSGASPMTVLSKHVSECPIPPAERAPELGIPLGMSRLVMRALSKRPEDRFQRVEELQALLIEEIRAAGSSSVEGLLDPSRLRHLVRTAEPAKDNVKPTAALATRDEVDAYERKLRRKRDGAAGLCAALVVTAGIGASLLFPRDARFSGVEVEPNNTAAEATVIPLGQATTGDLGKRIDASHGDRDFYAFDLSASAPGAKAFLRLRVSALPDMPMCSMLYRPGFSSAVGQYCVGRPGRDLVIPTLELEPGRYLLAVVQDLDTYGGAPTYVHENISDTYSVLAEGTVPEPGTEIEPNDQVGSATQLGLEEPCSATLGWTRDEDVFCVPQAITGRLRWKVRTGLRDGGVLEATQMRGGEEGAQVRIHADERGKSSAADVVGPWQSAPIAADAGAPRCLRVRLTTDPWSPPRVAGVPNGGREPYSVEAEAVPSGG